MAQGQERSPARTAPPTLHPPHAGSPPVRRPTQAPRRCPACAGGGVTIISDGLDPNHAATPADLRMTRCEARAGLRA